MNTDRGALAVVIDPDELLCWSVGQSLAEAGYRVRLAADPGKAFDYGDAAVAILDHDLPSADGLSTAADLRRRCPGCAVVLMCPDPSPLLRRRAREAGIDAVLEKPFSLEALQDAVQKAVEGAPGRSRHPTAGSGAMDEGGEAIDTKVSDG